MPSRSSGNWAVRDWRPPSTWCAGTGVTEAGTDEIRGTTVTGITATISLRDQFEASGQNAMLEGLGMGPGGPDTDALLDTETTFTVWVGDDGLIRRVDSAFDFADLMASTGTEGTFAMRMVLDVFDFGVGDPIDVPTDSVDVTSGWEQIMGLAG